MTENRMRPWKAIARSEQGSKKSEEHEEHEEHEEREREREREREGEREGSTCSPGRTYRFYDSTVCRGRLNVGLLYEFGYGLSSYGRAWAYAGLQVTWAPSRPRVLLVQLHVTPPAGTCAGSSAGSQA
eukprot:3141122-Rhodomonas_salina.1